jgi:hypothetical protein
VPEIRSAPRRFAFGADRTSSTLSRCSTRNRPAFGRAIAVSGLDFSPYGGSSEL